ncbi:hypothetical protein AQ906_04600 [Burkholderia pseudomallei]|nr:hypothetical protein AQ906_04600 [Burkholderia pseudomallei]
MRGDGSRSRSNARCDAWGQREQAQWGGERRWHATPAGGAGDASRDASPAESCLEKKKLVPQRGMNGRDAARREP